MGKSLQDFACNTWITVGQPLVNEDIIGNGNFCIKSEFVDRSLFRIYLDGVLVNGLSKVANG